MYRIKETVEAVNKIGQLMQESSPFVSDHPEVCMIPILSQIAISIAVIADCIDRVEDEETVPVVRCKDCTYWLNAEVNEKGFVICPASGMEITEDDFCSYGEKVTE